LDRALANNSWHVMYSDAMLENLPAPASYHNPIQLLCEPSNKFKRTISRFKFKNAWFVDLGFGNFVDGKWKSYGDQNIVNKLDMCASNLMVWSRDNFQQLRRVFDSCRKKIDNMRGSVNEDNIICFNNLQNQMSRLLVQEDSLWRQRAKAHWLRDGDLNTKFFHAATTSRNRISSLIDAANNRVTQESDLCNVAKDYFLELFQGQNSNVAPAIGVIAEFMMGEDNVKLTSPFLIEEFKEAIFSMKPDKCPGPDGFNLGFFQKFWPLCGEEIFKQCCGWLQSGVLPPTINMTNIALIPKRETQVSMKD